MRRFCIHSLLGGVTIFATIIGILFVVSPGGEIMPALYKTLFVAGGIAAVAFFPITSQIMEGVGGVSGISYYLAALMGLAVTLALFRTDYYTSKRMRPSKILRRPVKRAMPPNIIAGLAVGMQSTAAPVVVIQCSDSASYWICGGGIRRALRRCGGGRIDAVDGRYRGCH